MRPFAFLNMLFASLLMATPAIHLFVIAQEQKPKLPSLVAQLDLKDSQKKKLEAMYEEQQKKIKALREDSSMSDEDKKARLREINQTTNKSLGEILTYEQRKKLKELRQQNRSK